MHSTRRGWLLFLVAAIAGPVRAEVVLMNASLDCAQAATCGAGGTGTGGASISYDTVSNLLSWNIAWTGLSGTQTLSHFHGPAAPGVSAGIQVNTGIPSPRVGSATITETQEAQLLAGLWYLNVHSSTFGGGEIRGQVLAGAFTPTVTQWGVIALTLAGLALATLAIGQRAVVLASTRRHVVLRPPVLVPGLLLLCLAAATALAVAGCGIAWLVHGELALRDALGSLVCAALAAYTLHLWVAWAGGSGRD